MDTRKREVDALLGGRTLFSKRVSIRHFQSTAAAQYISLAPTRVPFVSETGNFSSWSLGLSCFRCTAFLIHIAHRTSLMPHDRNQVLSAQTISLPCETENFTDYCKIRVADWVMHSMNACCVSPLNTGSLIKITWLILLRYFVPVTDILHDEIMGRCADHIATALNMIVS